MRAQTMRRVRRTEGERREKRGPARDAKKLETGMHKSMFAHRQGIVAMSAAMLEIAMQKAQIARQNFVCKDHELVPARIVMGAEL